MNGGHYHLWKKLIIDSKHFKVIELLVLVFWGKKFIDVKWVFDFVNKCWFGFLNISNQLDKH
jgi:hypothetical protein